MRNKDNKAKTSEVNRKVTLSNRFRKHRSQRITEIKRKAWGVKK